MKKFGSVFVVIVFMVGAIFFNSFIRAIPVYFVWNLIMPDLFSLPTITFWQSFGLTLLSSCFFDYSSSNSKKD